MPPVEVPTKKSRSDLGQWTWGAQVAASGLTGNKHVSRYYDCPVIYSTLQNSSKTDEAQQGYSKSSLVFPGIRVRKTKRECRGDTEFRKYCITVNCFGFCKVGLNMLPFAFFFLLTLNSLFTWLGRLRSITSTVDYVNLDSLSRLKRSWCCQSLIL